MMQKLNLNFSDTHNTITSICWICSVLSWLLFIITNLICYHWINDFGTVWTIYRIPIGLFMFSPFKTTDNNMGNYPIQMHKIFIFVVFTILLIIFIVAFCLYMYKSICNKDIPFFDEMFNNYTKFHFIPILFGAFLFLVAETISDNSNRKDRQRNIVGMILVIIGLASMIFIYIKTNLPSSDWKYAIIKKGAYSSLIALEWYYFCYDIVNLRINDESFDEHIKTINTCGIIFSIIIGLGALAFAFYFKDVVVAFIHLLIYIGMTAFFFGIDSDFKKILSYNTTADGIIDIAMTVLLLAEIIFLIYMHKTECLK